MFVVLSAKQDMDSSGSDDEASDDEELDDERAPGEHVLTEKFDVSRMGILLEDVSDGHFQRTGAFVFNNINSSNWEELIEPEETKFWLD
jgi:hypothetical protein